MIEEKQNRVSVKIFEETHTALKKEKRRIEDETGIEPDYADLIGTAVQAQLGKIDVGAVRKRKNDKWFEMLSRILDSEHQVAINAITENLIAFDRLVAVDRESRPKVANSGR